MIRSVIFIAISSVILWAAAGLSAALVIRSQVLVWPYHTAENPLKISLVKFRQKNLPPSHLLPGTAVFCHSSKLLPNKGSPCSANSQFTRNTHPSRRFNALSISYSSGHARYRRLSRSAVVFLRPRANWLMSCSVSRTFPPRKIRLTLASGIPLAVASSFCVMPSFWRSAWICLARADCSFLL